MTKQEVKTFIKDESEYPESVEEVNLKYPSYFDDARKVMKNDEGIVAYTRLICRDVKKSMLKRLENHDDTLIACKGCIHQPKREESYPEICGTCSRWYADGYATHSILKGELE